MRVWLFDDRRGEPSALDGALRQLAAPRDHGLILLGTGPCSPEALAEVRVLKPDVLLIHEPAWPETAPLEEVAALGASMVVAAAPERTPRFSTLAEIHPIFFIPLKPGTDCLWLALQGALAGQRRQVYWKQEVDRLQRRLNDRIVIERAKGVLVERLRISEEEAYNRLRVLSRRQRRQIRDIAQSLLDTQGLLAAEENGVNEHPRPDAAQPAKP